MRRDPRKRYSLTPKFEAPDGVQPVFGGLMPRRIEARQGYLVHMVVEGDRLDRLANHYYGDPRMWWAIAQANPGMLTPADMIYRDAEADGQILKIGSEIQIPPKPEEAE